MRRLICLKPLRTDLKDSAFIYVRYFTTQCHEHVTEMEKTDPKYPTISCLKKSRGLSSKSAISTSRKLQIHIEKTEDPDSVLNVLKNLGLSQIHIQKLIAKRPSLLFVDLENTLKPNLDLFKSLGFTTDELSQMFLRDPRVLEGDAKVLVDFLKSYGFSQKQILSVSVKRPALYAYNIEKVIRPKLEFFKSLGFSETEMAKICAAETYILERSLENHIIPCMQFLTCVLGTEENALRVIRASFRVLAYNLEKVLKPNMSILVNHGVPESLILKLMLIQPKSLLLRTYRFNEILDEVNKLGLDPKNLLFVLAVRSMGVMSKALWEKKLEVFMSFGLTKEEVYSAFKMQPNFMLVSEKKIRKVIGFFLNELGMKPSVISKNPNVLLLSLEKRIIPRCSVLQLLMSKKLIERDRSLIHTLRMTEKYFTEKFVKKYEPMVPEIIRAHQGKLTFKGLSFICGHEKL